MKSTCVELEKTTSALQNDKSTLQSKINDLEYRSMRDNLLFYGIPESNGEDCEIRVRQFLGEKLELPQAEKVSSMYLKQQPPGPHPQRHPHPRLRAAPEGVMGSISMCYHGTLTDCIES